MEDTDISLMELVRKGDAKAFELLLSRHQRSVFNLALRFLGDAGEAEDITQEVFIRVYKSAGSYTPDAKFSTWLYTIVRNLCFNALRRRKVIAFVSMEEEALPEIPCIQDDPIQVIDRAQVRERVVSAVHGLPENMRFAVILNKFHGLQYEEIAKVLGCSVNAVKLRMLRAKSILARELAGLRDETK
jgi:RNA polymerase sigma-70 factor (ECF subfamily)